MDKSYTRDISQSGLQEIIFKSRTSARRRCPFPLHSDEYAGPQALINAIQPDSYMNPHMHPENDEIWTPVQGIILLGTFDNDGNPKDKILLAKNQAVYHLIPRGMYHFAFALEEDSVFLNVSQGPFNPSTSKVFPNWAPKENDNPDIVAEYFTRIKDMFLSL